MSVGTPSFMGSRLKEGREARGLTAIALSGILRITRQAVSYYETGQGTPQPEMAQKIADILDLPLTFFLRPSDADEESVNAIFYRSMSSTTKAARLRGEHRYKWLRDIVSYIRNFVKLPEVRLPSIDVPETPEALTEDAIEKIASATRRFWALGDGPISNVVLLLENNGAIVSRFEFEASTMDAFSTRCPSDDAPYIMLSTDKDSSVRSRYDAAHELGHIILHRNLASGQLNNKVTHRLIENQAHRFASAFLVPASSFSNEFYIPTLDAIRALKPKWLVSIGMMIYRAKELGLITEEQARRLWINYNRRGWKTQEPMDDRIPVEEPRLMRKAFELLIEKGIVTRSQMKADLPFNPTDIEELCQLPYGYLDEESPYVWAISNIGKNL